MRELRDKATTVMELRKALSVLLVAEAGFDASQTSEMLGISERTVFRNRSSIRHQDEGRRNTWGGRRHYSMTIEEEQIWNVLRRDYFANRVFDPLNAAILQAEHGLANMASNRETLKSLTNWPWISAILNAK